MKENIKHQEILILKLTVDEIKVARSFSILSVREGSVLISLVVPIVIDSEEDLSDAFPLVEPLPDPRLKFLNIDQSWSMFLEKPT